MRVRHTVAILIAIPLGLGAQQPQAADPANPLTTVFRGRTMTLQRNLAQAFDSIPEAKFGFKPTPAQQTIGYIAQHLVTDNYIFCDAFGDMKGTRAVEDTATADTLKAKWPKEKLVTQLKASFAFCEQAFGQLNDAKLVDQITRGQRTIPRATMVLGHVIDMADHYSQIANYMRLNNILPPTALPRPRP